MRKAGLTSFGSVVLAFLASQHHTLHMLLLTLGVGGAGMSFMTTYPTIRRVMLLMSLVMVGVTAYQIWRRGWPTAVRVMGGVSVVLTLGIITWSTMQFGI